MLKIAIDTLGGDLPLSEILEGALKTIGLNPNVEPLLIGPQEEIDGFFAAKNVKTPEVINANREVDNYTNPTTMLHDQDDSALVLSYNALKARDDVVALITCSATGCVIVGSIFHLGLEEGLRMPLLGALLKHGNGNDFLVADCGANLDVRPKDLVRFAELGSQYMSVQLHIEKPRVGLLSNGKEDGKGNAQIKETFGLLKTNEKINFVGNVEASDIFDDLCDVLVCDGMLGNVVIKTAESVALLVNSWGNDENIDSKVRSQFAYNDMAGSILIGTSKPIIKAHGKANRNTIVGCYKQLLQRLGY